MFQKQPTPIQEPNEYAHLGPVMVIEGQFGPIYITKAQAMAFFGLVEPSVVVARAVAAIEREFA